MKLLKLPFLVQKKLLQDFTLSCVVILSMLSKRTKRLLDACKYPIDSWAWVDIYSINLRKGRYEIVCFRIMHSKSNSNDSSFSLENGNVIVTKRNSDQETITKFDVNFVNKQRNPELKMQLNELISRFIWGFLKPNYTDLSFSETSIPVDTLFFWNITEEYRQMYLMDYYGTFFVTEDTLKFLLNNVTAECMQLKVKGPAMGFKFDRANQKVKQNHIVMWRTHFFHFESLVDTLNSQKITAYCESIEVMIKILKGWIQGQNNVLELLNLKLDFNKYESEDEEDYDDDDDSDDEYDGTDDTDNKAFQKFEDEFENFKGNEDADKEEGEEQDEDEEENGAEDVEQPPVERIKVKLEIKAAEGINDEAFQKFVVESENRDENEDDDEKEAGDESERDHGNDDQDEDEDQSPAERINVEHEIRAAEGINITRPTLTEEQWNIRFPGLTMATMAFEIRREYDNRPATIYFNGYDTVSVYIWTDEQLQGTKKQ